MNSMNEFPIVMKQAKEDLAGHISGQFSPESWDKILQEAHLRLKQHMNSGLSESEAWRKVVLEFSKERHWGYVPNWRPSKRKPKSQKENLGLRLIWMTFAAFVITKITVVWLGQIYTRSEDPVDKWLFIGSIILVLANFGYFLWRTRNHKD